MTFVSIQYAVFLPVVLGLYWLLKHRGQTILLLVASYVFYGAWDYRFLFLMMLTTVTDFVVGRGLERTQDERQRKRLFAVSIGLNLTVLGFFKYFNFFTDSAVQLFGKFGIHLDEPTLRILLPVGISFYTFHGISYTFDVFRRHIHATKSLITFAAFVSYFPQLVAGPIGRADVQLPQMENPRKRPDSNQVASALMLILLGFVKKAVIADTMAPFVAEIFSGARTNSAGTLLVGMYAFALQIYGDFSGYTDIARGTSRLFGIELLDNFNQPYLSRNISEFWRTWHISLSSWLRDYLYVPLGGNRNGRSAAMRNMFITMVLGGLWHGAAWTFVFWGALHGLFLAVHNLMPHRVNRRKPEPVGKRDILPILGTFHLVCFAWIFFRASSLSEAFAYIGGIVTLRAGDLNVAALQLLIPLGLLMLAIDLMQRNGRSETVFLQLPAPALGAVLGVMVAGLIIFSGKAGAPFIYFQF